jgi:hypothetical protein
MSNENDSKVAGKQELIDVIFGNAGKFFKGFE